MELVGVCQGIVNGDHPRGQRVIEEKRILFFIILEELIVLGRLELGEFNHSLLQTIVGIGEVELATGVNQPRRASS
jgi:hypothetical protein